MALDPRAVGEFRIVDTSQLQGWDHQWNSYESCTMSTPNRWWLDNIEPILVPLIATMRARIPSPDYTDLPDGRVRVHIVRDGIDIEFHGRWL